MTDLETNTAPVAVVVGRPGTGDGRMNNTVAVTADHFPNVLIKVISPLASIFVKSLLVFLQTILGGLTAAGGAAATGVGKNVLPVYDFGQALALSASFAVAAAVVCAIQNTIVLLSDIDKKYPLLR